MNILPLLSDIRFHPTIHFTYRQNFLSHLKERTKTEWIWDQNAPKILYFINSKIIMLLFVYFSSTSCHFHPFKCIYCTFLWAPFSWSTLSVRSFLSFTSTQNNAISKHNLNNSEPIPCVPVHPMILPGISWLQHREQKICPHTRQWWRRLKVVNFSPQS